MRKWRLIWRVINDVIRGKAEENISLSLSPSSLKSNWNFILSSMLRIIDKNNPTTRNFYGDRIFDVVDFIYLESFSKYLGTFGI